MPAIQPDAITARPPRARSGPNTEKGKKTVRRNAWKHGLSATEMVLPELEKEAEWFAHRDGTFESLEPEGHLEHMLAERIAIALWMLRRLDTYHMAHTISNMAGAHDHLQLVESMRQGFPKDGKPYKLKPNDIWMERLRRIIPDSNRMPLILRYQAHFHRQYLQTLHELEAIQEKRKGGHSPLIRMDVTGSPAGWPESTHIRMPAAE